VPHEERPGHYTLGRAAKLAASCGTRGVRKGGQIGREEREGHECERWLGKERREGWAPGEGEVWQWVRKTRRVG